MFPINFNFPYRKKDGSLITMEKALDGAGADLDLVDLDDVAITDPAEGDGLIYDNTAHKWKNRELTNQIHIDSTSITTNTQSGNAAPYSYYGSTNIGIKKLIGIWAYETSTAVPVPCGYNSSNGYAFCVSKGTGIEVTVHYAYID